MQLYTRAQAAPTIQHWTQPVVKRVGGAAAAAVGWLDNGEKITNGTLLISRSPILLGGL